MNKLKLPAFFLAAVMVMALTACGGPASKDSAAADVLPDKNTDQTESGMKQDLSGQKLPEELQETWIRWDDVGAGQVVTRLTLMADGTAQLPIQNEIGELRALCVGSWSAENKILTLTLTPDSAMEPFFPPDWETIGGEYHYRIAENGRLYLSDLGNPCPIVPYMSDMTLSFESSAAVAEREERETEVLGAVLAYYKAQYDAEYPGWAEVDCRNDDGTLSVRISEDMGDHRATAAWYTVDPETLWGRDDMLGGDDIDFSPYRDGYGS